MSARLAAYASTQLRDFLTGRVLALASIMGLAGWAYFSFAGVTRNTFDPSGGFDAREQVRAVFENLLGVFAFVGGGLTAYGLAARDRWRRYDRLLFARPLSPARYYAQSFAIAGLVVILIGVAVAQLFAVAVQPVSVVGVAAYVALAWITIGGLGFLLSSVTRYHAFVLAALVAGALALDGYRATLHATPDTMAQVGLLADAAQYVLPPAQIVAALRGPFARGLMTDPAEVAWPLGFGIACVVAAVLVLRRRPVGS